MLSGLVTTAALACVKPANAPVPERASAVSATTNAEVRRELEQKYEQLKRALLAKDYNAVIAFRAPDFHSVTPDGVVHDRAEMDNASRALLTSIDHWISIDMKIDSLEVVGDLAHALIYQHADRMAMRNDGKVHHVENWVTQRETWRRTSEGWKMYRVDNIRDQRRFLDGVRF
jgi:ketosteroid isomerase-like protein